MDPATNRTPEITQMALNNNIKYTYPNKCVHKQIIVLKLVEIRGMNYGIMQSLKNCCTSLGDIRAMKASKKQNKQSQTEKPTNEIHRMEWLSLE